MPVRTLSADFKVAVSVAALWLVMAALPPLARITGPDVAMRRQAASVLANAETKTPDEPAPTPRPLRAGPPALQARLDEITQRFGGKVGIAITDVDAGWTVTEDGAGAYPQQSVSKLWVAIAVLDAVDRGKLSLDRPILMTRSDLSVFYQPIARKVGSLGYQTSIRELLLRAITDSDNAANDMLIRQAGGPGPITAALKRKHLEGVRVGYEERILQSRMAGMEWRPEYAGSILFREARAALPDTVRDQAMAAYLADPPDAASPLGMVAGLRRLKRGELLSPASTQLLLEILSETRTGPRRLKGGLPDGWTILHKTGTGQDLRNYSVGINDVGILIAPDGRAYAVAVMIAKTTRGVGARMAFMQQVAEALAQTWDGSSGKADATQTTESAKTAPPPEPAPHVARGRHHAEAAAKPARGHVKSKAKVEPKAEPKSRRGHRYR
jgi:beta-lactamase class A